MVALITIGHVQTQGVVVTFYRDRIVLVVPRRQLDARIQRDRFPQHGILLAKRFKGVVSARHIRQLVMKEIVSLRSVAPRYQRCHHKKAQDSASQPQDAESRAVWLTSYCFLAV
ncbi:hypothetical protein D3C86_1790590 [compost metagenome]